MIELTQSQVQAMSTPDSTPPRVVNPLTHETFVLLPVREYERLLHDDYDASPWTAEEMDQLALEAGDMLDSFGKQQ